MINFFKYLFVPKPPVVETPQMIIARELHETQVDILKARKEQEYWHSMSLMLAQREIRLKLALQIDAKS